MHTVFESPEPKRAYAASYGVVVSRVAPLGDATLDGRDFLPRVHLPHQAKPLLIRPLVRLHRLQAVRHAASFLHGPLVDMTDAVDQVFPDRRQVMQECPLPSQCVPSRGAGSSREDTRGLPTTSGCVQLNAARRRSLDAQPASLIALGETSVQLPYARSAPNPIILKAQWAKVGRDALLSLLGHPELRSARRYTLGWAQSAEEP